MSDFLAVLVRTITGRWKRSLLVAVAVLFGLIAVSAAAPEPPPDNFNVPGAESQEALDLFSEHVPALAGVDATVVYSVEDGRLGEPAQAPRSRSFPGRTAGAARCDLGRRSVRRAQARASRVTGAIAATDVRYDLEFGDVTSETGQALEQAARTAEPAGSTSRCAESSSMPPRSRSSRSAS